MSRCFLLDRATDLSNTATRNNVSGANCEKTLGLRELHCSVAIRELIRYINTKKEAI